MRTVAYIRISTGGQDFDSQRLAILDYAHRQGLTVNTFVEAQVSSRQTAARQGLDTVLEQLQPGDLLLVSELSRLGRSVGQIIHLVDRLIKQCVRLVAIKENIQLNGTQDIQTKVMITLFGLFAEIERDLIAECTKEGLAAARAKGRLSGRPKGVLGTSKLTGREAEIQTLLAKTVSKASIAKIMDVSRSTLHHSFQTLDLSVQGHGAAATSNPQPVHAWSVAHDGGSGPSHCDAATARDVEGLKYVNQRSL
jgi:DNA invertase Pin-like site-specific DNA recombinase